MAGGSPSATPSKPLSSRSNIGSSLAAAAASSDSDLKAENKHLKKQLAQVTSYLSILGSGVSVMSATSMDVYKVTNYNSCFLNYIYTTILCIQSYNLKETAYYSLQGHLYFITKISTQIT